MGSSLNVFATARQVFQVLRLAPFDVSMPDGRSKERHRRVALTAIASMGASGVQVLTTIISVPLTVHYLGPERYGMWMTISSLIAILGFTDLGMGNGLLNVVAKANGNDDRDMAANAVSSAFFMLSGVAIILGVLLLWLYPLVPWKRVFNVSSVKAVAEAGPATAVFLGCFLFNMPMGVIQRIQLGYQEGFVNSLWLGSGSLLGLAGVIVAIHFQAGLTMLVLAMAGSPIIATLLNGVVLFVFKRPWLRPKWRRVTWTGTREVLHLGILFFALQIAGALSYQSANIVIAQMLGPDLVAQYSITMRLFTFVPLMLAFVFSPLWPAYGEAVARRDMTWVRKTLKRSIIFGFLANVPAAILLVSFGVKILHLWVGPGMTPSYTLLAGMGLWAVLNSLGGPIAAFLNGASVIKFQIICALLMGLTSLAMSIALVHVIGLPGVIYATVIAQVVFIFLPCAFFIPRLLSSMQLKYATA